MDKRYTAHPASSRELVLLTIAYRGTAPRALLIRVTKLSHAAMTRLLKAMNCQGLIESAGRHTYRLGRRAPFWTAPFQAMIEEIRCSRVERIRLLERALQAEAGYVGNHD